MQEMKRKVLIVDDDAISRMMMRLYLDTSFDVLEAENGSTGIEAVTTHGDVSVVFLDLNMPKMDGYDFLEALQKKYAERPADIYITSCSPRAEFYGNATSRGLNTDWVTGYYEKPFMMERVLQEI
jgi:two-component system chemotaxis response regulator CheY